MDESKKLSNQLTANYSVIQCIYIMGYCSIFSFASVYLLSRGFTNSQVGITLTLANGLALLFQPVVASFADRSKKLALRNIAAIMLAITSVFAFLMLLTPAIVLPTAILYILLVTFFSTQISLVTSMSMEHINNGVPINFSLARGIGSFAFAILSFLLGYLVDAFGAQVIMLVNIGLGILGMVLVSTFRKPEKKRAAENEVESQASSLLEFGRKNKRFMAVVAGVTLLFFSHTLINTYMIQIIHNVGGNNSDMGIATAIAGFLELPAMALFPLMYKKLPNAATFLKIAGLFFVIKAILTLAAPNVFWIDAAQCLQFFGYALLTPASVFYVNQVIKDADKVKGQSLMGMTMGISGLFGNFLGGFMLDSSGGVPFMLTVGIVVSLAGLILLVAIDKFRPQRAAES
jgi:MFS transporter, PPP family, 3-phenylpropionic acid transporter